MVVAFLFEGCKKSSTAEIEELPYLPGTALYDVPVNKLWAHRINFSNLANDKLLLFPGIELDLTYDVEDNTFVLFHNKAELPILADFLNEIENVEKHYYWFDFKNLNVNNCVQSKNRLDSLLALHQIKQRTIIESPVASQLKSFVDDDFFVSYWVPYISDQDTVSWINKMNKGLDGFVPNAISGPYQMYGLMDKYFGNMNIHLWTNGLITEEHKSIIEELAKQENVKVILVDYEDNFLYNP